MRHQSVYLCVPVAVLMEKLVYIPNQSLDLGTEKEEGVGARGFRARGFGAKRFVSLYCNQLKLVSKSEQSFLFRCSIQRANEMNLLKTNHTC